MPRVRVRIVSALAACLYAWLAPAAAVAEEAVGERAVATFAGGCFWCMEGPFDVLEGVISTTSGYIGGSVENPTYDQVSRGKTGHAEAVQVVYDAERISYERLLEVFWHNVDPTTADGQFCDHGNQYRPAIFVHDAAQRAAAEASRAALERDKPFSGDIAVAIEDATTFYPAEDYHQDFYVKNAFRYRFYRYNCGRDQRLEELWGTAH